MANLKNIGQKFDKQFILVLEYTGLNSLLKTISIRVMGGGGGGSRTNRIPAVPARGITTMAVSVDFCHSEISSKVALNVFLSG